ncbi:MAG: Dihydrodipicolinate reductase [Candidatus Nomurabacteria bacterium GW2011_GWF2_40_31]|uniref:4-hydroxy-tetrahydrodipicolinate reductase n=2 Tax=Candidatus Nomuraibacteriota TaxID=1752729 RepID=A0A837HX61_9BACT|nr:MAG: Dihydrodipicolinate reductase [Candidatus Nomurabacteria bacterium GW2011_GWD2_39_12]KKR21022.1 MAG: Dihydrodipicolinate reductase [Candidatus Nomurabacteria bacterium GW2011_GWC2_39_41]KKR37025.1 MAG: Dihydrodipicolinate reductase [Candidatus Nomurabacteria bacterium GW2011_GWE2_40_10]KKR38971.1 MAG: Dihydrodipicolinate reductase [Candidatus Nomurabacteria bacterium GW2011_GWB1_40_11]KKR40213.1 MAG: Dihydrodipicolinate reductase [Parcubacteria group bacterium GW2011_GWC1_40_11]KKR5935
MKSRIKIALIGFGKMGKEVNALCEDSRDFEVVSVSYKNINDKLDVEGIKKADVAIDFTSPDVVIKNIEQVGKLGVNMVIGTTGWYDKMDTVKKLVSKNKIGLVYSPNFSVGVNIFFKIMDFASSLFAKFPDYDVYGLEVHHKAKLDSPSGTALKIASKVNGLNFTSIRAGRNPGFHEVVFDSVADGITFSHQAYSRMGFAKGALLATKFISNKKGMYPFEHLFKI